MKSPRRRSVVVGIAQPENDTEGVCYRQPRNLRERLAIARLLGVHALTDADPRRR
jgi:hypothetical protein